MTLANLVKTIKEKKAKANVAKQATSSAWDTKSLAELATLAPGPKQLCEIKKQQVPYKKQLVQVKCIDCEHFASDKIGDGGGIGSCGVGITWTQQVHGRMPLYPNVLSYCSHFSKLII